MSNSLLSNNEHYDRRNLNIKTTLHRDFHSDEYQRSPGEEVVLGIRASHLDRPGLERLKDTEDPLTADHVRQVIDDSAEEARLWLEKNVK